MRWRSSGQHKKTARMRSECCDWIQSGQQFRESGHNCKLLPKPIGELELSTDEPELSDPSFVATWTGQARINLGGCAV